MSNVYKRLRGKTDTQFIVNALELQTLITQYCVKEKFVPKKYRLLIGVPLINKVDEMVDNITFANAIYVTNERESEKRKEYQVKAISNCYQLQNYIIKLEKTIDSVTISSLDKIIDLLCNELNLLKAWKNQIAQKIKIYRFFVITSVG